MTRSLHFAFAGRQLLLSVTPSGELRVPDTQSMATCLGTDPGTLEGAEVPLKPALERTCHAYDLPADFQAPPGYALMGLRRLHGVVPDELFHAAGTALQKIDWLRTHGFCSRCGQATTRHVAHEAMECSSCGHLQFPRLAPAVIVLIERGREMLLARSPGWPPGLYSTIAGFVEPGESLEEALHREVREEVGVRVANVRYFGSQPWPFPHSLMVGFIATWESGEIEIDPSEIEDARWFSGSALPELPFPLSIARHLVDDFLNRTKAQPG